MKGDIPTKPPILKFSSNYRTVVEQRNKLHEFVDQKVKTELERAQRECNVDLVDYLSGRRPNKRLVSFSCGVLL